MPVDEQEVHSPAAIVGVLELLINLGKEGVEVRSMIGNGLGMLETAECKTMEDALALLSLSHQFVTGIVVDEEGFRGDQLAVIGRFMDAAWCFLNAHRHGPHTNASANILH